MKLKRQRIIVDLPNDATAPVPIVSAPAVAKHTVAGGRLIPLLILDTTRRPDIEDAIRAHRYLSPGDLHTQWGRDPRKKRELDVILLLCEFERPVKCTMLVAFHLPEMVPVVDLLVGAGAMYLQPGKPGDTLLATMHQAPRILAEVPSQEFGVIWDSRVIKVLERQLRSRGLRKREATEGAREMVRLGRELRGFRAPSS